MELIELMDDFSLGLFLVGAVLPFILIGIAKGVGRVLGIYTIIKEREAKVFVLFGKVVGTITTPGFHFLWGKIGLSAILLHAFGKTHTVDMRLDQSYLRGTRVNSEEGAPMGVGVWYEMRVTDPESYLFKNTSPRTALSANVGSSTVRCLSNLPLDVLMTDRNSMSATVRDEVSSRAADWGFQLGSCYIRKVQFLDENMITQIQGKVESRLRQITSAILQDGANQVSVIQNTAEKKAANDFGEASAIRPRLVGELFSEISQDPDVSVALFEIMESTRIVLNKTSIRLVDAGINVIASDSGC